MSKVLTPPANKFKAIFSQNGPWVKYARVFLLLVVFGVSIFIFSIRGQAERFAAYGYPGIFLLSLLSHATVILPAPGFAIVFAFGSVFNPFLVGLVAGAGAAVGELSGYAAGVSGQGVAQNVALYTRLIHWMGRNKYLAFFLIVLLAAIPNPLFDLAGMAAGVLKIGVAPFMLATFIGKTLKMWLFAYAGSYSIDWLYRMLHP